MVRNAARAATAPSSTSSARRHDRCERDDAGLMGGERNGNRTAASASRAGAGRTEGECAGKDARRQAAQSRAPGRRVIPHAKARRERQCHRPHHDPALDVVADRDRTKIQRQSIQATARATSAGGRRAAARRRLGSSNAEATRASSRGKVRAEGVEVVREAADLGSARSRATTHPSSQKTGESTTSRAGPRTTRRPGVRAEAARKASLADGESHGRRSN